VYAKADRHASRERDRSRRVLLLPGRKRTVADVPLAVRRLRAAVADDDRAMYRSRLSRWCCRASGLRERVLLVRPVRRDLRTRCRADDLVQSIRVRYRRIHVCRSTDHVGVARCPDPGGGPVHARRTGHSVRKRAGRGVREMFAGPALRSKVSARRVRAAATVPGRPQRRRRSFPGRPVAHAPPHAGNGRAGRLHGDG